MSAKSQSLLNECRDMAKKRLVEVIAAALGKIDDDLFQLANQSREREEQKIYLDAMGKVREHRAGIERRFEECFAELFEKRLTPAPVPAPTNDWGGVELSLVSHSKIEGSIHIDRLAKGIKKAADDDELLGIRARLGHLLSRESLDDADNPLSPELIFEALKLACHQIPAGASVKDAVLTAFQPYLSESINSVYHAINANLVAHDVLPRIKHSVKTSADPLGRTGRMAAMNQSQRMGLLNDERVGAGAEERTGWLGGTSARDIQTLGNLLNGIAHGRAGARGEAVNLFADPQRFPAGPGAVPASSVLLDSLSRLQEITEQGALDEVATLRQIDRALVAQGTPLDQLTLELVTVVFDFLLSNASLPESVKGVISRLQIVAIKAALLDRSFFARREHPMRRLLDRMAEAGLDPLADVSTDSPFMQGLRKLTDTLCSDFHDDCVVFEQALSALELLVEAQHAARHEEARSSTEALEVTEARASARASARADIALRLKPTMPQFISGFLNEWWTEAVALSAMTGGGEEDSADARLRLASDLAWSVEAKSRSDVPALASMLPGLVRGLMRGTRDVGMPDDLRDGFFSQLMATHTGSIAEAKRAAADIKTAPRPAAAEAVRRAPEPVVAVSQDRYARDVSNLVKGDLVDFSDERANDRFRLGWISPKKTFYMFMGSGRMRQLSGEQLAALFRQGAATMAPMAAPIVDQAIESMSLDFTSLAKAA